MRQAIRDFARGMGQAFDMGGTLGPSRIVSNPASQGAAIRSYWAKVGGNLRHAMGEVEANGKGFPK